MKKIMIMILTCVAMSFTTQKYEKVLKVEMTLAKWDHHFQKLGQIQSYVNGSNLPHQDVVFIYQTIDSLLMDLRAQLIPQIDTVKKK